MRMSASPSAMNSQTTSPVLHGLETEEPREQPPWVDLAQRMQRAERQSRWLKIVLFIMAPLLVYVFIGHELPEKLVRKEPLVAASHMQLYDDDGNTRLYMRVYSGVPVVQLIDAKGKPRLSLGLRYDNSPFISLSDTEGQTRATLQVGEDDKPALRLYDEQGEPSFAAY